MAQSTSQCPFCWKGVIYSTGVRQRRKPHHFIFQCRYCGRIMTRAMHDARISHIEHLGREHGAGQQPKKKAVQQKQPKRTAAKVTVPRPGFVVGIVKDGRTGAPLESAHACIRGRSVEAFTNRYGQYALDPIPEHRDVDIVFSSPGHMPKEVLLSRGIKAGEVRRLDVSLSPLAPAKQPKPKSRLASLVSAQRSVREGIEGVVRDHAGEPVLGALITVFHRERTIITRTDAMGHYELIGLLPPGDYMVRAASYGHMFARKWCRVAAGEAARCDFVLSERKRV